VNRDRLKIAMEEVGRFLAVAHALKAATKHEEHYDDFLPSKWSGAVRRASMDLTRALATLRRGK
jgi:hypothetical protein